MSTPIDRFYGLASQAADRACVFQDEKGGLAATTSREFVKTSCPAGVGGQAVQSFFQAIKETVAKDKPGGDAVAIANAAFQKAGIDLKGEQLTVAQIISAKTFLGDRGIGSSNQEKGSLSPKNTIQDIHFDNFAHLAAKGKDTDVVERRPRGGLEAVDAKNCKPEEAHQAADCFRNAVKDTMTEKLGYVKVIVNRELTEEEKLENAKIEQEIEGATQQVFQRAHVDLKDEKLTIGQIKSVQNAMNDTNFLAFSQAQVGGRQYVVSGSNPAVPSPTDREIENMKDVRYEYQDQNMAALGRVYEETIKKLREQQIRQQVPKDRQAPETIFLAPVSNLEKQSDGAQMLGTAIQSIIDTSLEKHKSLPTPLQIAIPYNLGNYHWTGILIKIGDEKKNKITVEHMDSLKGKTPLSEEAKNAIKNALAPYQKNIDFQEIEAAYHQPDKTSCGPCAMENLRVRAGAAPMPAEPARTDMQALRQAQVQVLIS